MGWEGGELAHRLAVLFRESLTQRAMQAFVPTGNAIDITDLLWQLNVPTLVLHRRQLQALSEDVARVLAARIPDARLALLEGAAMLPMAGDMEAALEAIKSSSKFAWRTRRRRRPPPGASRPSSSPMSKAPPSSPNAWAMPTRARSCASSRHPARVRRANHVPSRSS